MKIVHGNKLVLFGQVYDMTDEAAVPDPLLLIEAASAVPILQRYSLADRAGAYLFCALEVGEPRVAWIEPLAMWMCGLIDPLQMVLDVTAGPVANMRRKLLQSVGIPHDGMQPLCSRAVTDIVWAAETSAKRVSCSEIWQEVERVKNQELIKKIGDGIVTGRQKFTKLLRGEVIAKRKTYKPIVGKV